MTSAPAIGFEYRPSRWMARALALIGALAVVAVLASGWPAWVQVVVVGVVAVCVARALRHWRLAPVRMVACDTAGQWQLRLRDDSDVAVALAGFRVFGPCILLRFRVAARRESSLLLAPDNSDADLRRRLRARLAALDLDAALPRI